MKVSIRKAKRIDANAIAVLAAQGVARAIDDRSAVVEELTDEEIAQVGGGRAGPPQIFGPVIPGGGIINGMIEDYFQHIKLPNFGRFNSPLRP